MIATGIRAALVSTLLLGGLVAPALADGTAVTATGAVSAVIWQIFHISVTADEGSVTK